MAVLLALMYAHQNRFLEDERSSRVQLEDRLEALNRRYQALALDHRKLQAHHEEVVKQKKVVAGESELYKSKVQGDALVHGVFPFPWLHFLNRRQIHDYRTEGASLREKLRRMAESLVRHQVLASVTQCNLTCLPMPYTGGVRVSIVPAA